MIRKPKSYVSERQVRNRLRADAARLADEARRVFPNHERPPDENADLFLHEIDRNELPEMEDKSGYCDTTDVEGDSFDYASDPEGRPDGDEDRSSGEWEYEDASPELTEQQQIIRDLASWAVHCRIPRTHVNKLLLVLAKYHSHSFLPKDYRTLLNTVRNVRPKLVEPGLYFHLGIAHGLSRSLQLFHTDIGSNVNIFINIDGIPISKSGSSQFWPILGKIVGVKNAKPFVIGVYWGSAKPKDVNIYLADFVEEAIILKRVGFKNEEKTIFVHITAFICDRPALAFILCIKSHTGFFSCLKCTTKGVSFRPNVNNKKSNFLVFPELNSPLRTDTSFRARSNPEHHLPGVSLLENLLEFDLVNGILLDGMHLTDLGAMKKLILHYIKGKYERVRMSKSNKATLAARVTELIKYVPFEFPRKIESLDFVDSWKATSYRMVKLYLGPLLFKNIIRRDLFDHFLLFHTAMKLLSDEEKCFKTDILNYCQELLVKFVADCISLFGLQFLSSNIHHLVHVVIDVARFGPLDSFAAYPFENLLQILKNLVRKSAKPLQQLVRRIGEMEMLEGEERPTNLADELLDCHECGPIMPGIFGYQFKNLIFKGTKLGTDLPNNCIFLTSNRVACIENFIQQDNSILLIGRQFFNVGDFFHCPVPSRNLNCFEVWNLGPLAIWPLQDVIGKAFIAPSFEVPTQEKRNSYVATLLIPHDSTSIQSIE